MGDDHSIFSEHLRLFLNIFFFVNIGAIRMHGVVEGPRGITQPFCITFETLRICVKIYLGIFFKKNLGTMRIVLLRDQEGWEMITQ